MTGTPSGNPSSPLRCQLRELPKSRPISGGPTAQGPDGGVRLVPKMA